MTWNRMPEGAHLGDGVLLALHDHESGASPEVQSHVAACSECQARLESIRTDAERVRTALLAVPVPSFDVEAMRRKLSERRAAPVAASSRWRRPAIQIVAALALATAAAASVGPIRTLIARRNPPVATPTTPREAPTPRPAARAGTTISFPETGPVFTVRFDSTPAAGDLEIDSAATADVSAQATTVGDASPDAMVVLPHELRLRNAAASTASYRIIIPGSVERMRVVVAGRALFEGPPRHARIALSSGRRE